MPVQIRRGAGFPATVRIVGSSTLPAVCPQSLALADAGASECKDEAVKQCERKASNFPWPYWRVKRCDSKADANCHLYQCLVRVVTAITAEFAHADAVEVPVPIVTNFAAIETCEELVVHWESKNATPKAPSEA